MSICQGFWLQGIYRRLLGAPRQLAFGSLVSAFREGTIQRN